MARILRASELPPPFERRLLVLLSALTSSSATMGLLAGPPVSALDTASVRRLLRVLPTAGFTGLFQVCALMAVACASDVAWALMDVARAMAVAAELVAAASMTAVA